MRGNAMSRIASPTDRRYNKAHLVKCHFIITPARRLRTVRRQCMDTVNIHRGIC